ncbi:MAG: hypothetical protein IJ055_06795 [Oscillospiraceae bacterium]|nr:hypothetical protein [Oscillospiraceae bacterium]
MKGRIVPVHSCTDAQTGEMYALMAQHYDNTDEAVFRSDLMDKDYVLLLEDDAGAVVGFTTQKLLSVPVDGQEVRGVFSGDTIIRQDLWGEPELFRVWAQFWFPYARQFEEFYWFLICKGYKTYRILPLFWQEFYPSRRAPVPERMQRIMDAYAGLLYPGDYNPATGVVEYLHSKDRLRPGVADLTPARLRNPDVAYFAKRNPGHVRGNDLVCLARIDRACMKASAQRVLFR